MLVYAKNCILYYMTDKFIFFFGDTCPLLPLQTGGGRIAPVSVEPFFVFPSFALTTRMNRSRYQRAALLRDVELLSGVGRCELNVRRCRSV